MKTKLNKKTLTQKKTKSSKTKHFQLIEHNILEKTHLATLNQITNTSQYTKLYNSFTQTGLILYYIVNTQNTIIGYIFIGYSNLEKLLCKLLKRKFSAIIA